jgi:N6-adenosine-specific RNA methylase IME4
MTGVLFDMPAPAPRKRHHAAPVVWPDWPFGDLAPASYDLIHIDPPNAYEMWGAGGYGKAPQAHYDCVDLDDLKRLPVGKLARRDCVLLLWCWWPFAAIGAHVEMFRAWDFEGKTGFPWLKRTKHGKVHFGPGYILRECTEMVFVATRGKPAWDDSFCAKTRGVIDAEAREHSRKPDDVYAIAEGFMPHARRVDLFGRAQRPGWDVWGNETTKFGGGSTVAGPAPIAAPAAPAVGVGSLAPAAGVVDASARASEDDLLEIPAWLRRDPVTNRILGAAR